MGYRFDIAIAVHKSIIARDLIDPIIPEVLKEEPFQDIGEARHWLLCGWKFYDSYQEVQDIQNFFDALDEESIQEPNSTYQYAVYGALRIGEDDDDVQSWGDPQEYQIYLNRSISSPFVGEVL